jgi:glycosyltransferase involved in cell wall biosynthesis
MKRLSIAYITETSVNDKHAWSGTAHYVYKALLNQGFEVIALGPGQPFLLRYVFAAINKASILLFKKRFDYRHSSLYSKAFAKLFTKKLNAHTYDLIVVCGGTEYGAFLNSKKPIYYVLDRTIAGAIQYHSILSDLWSFSEEQSITTDKRAMMGAEKVFFSSPWAANHAITHYGLSNQKAVVIPFGANMDNLPNKELALRKKDNTVWRLLLIGTYWTNKGADIAYNTLLYLLEKGIKAELTIVGCMPPEAISHPQLNIIPFIDKNTVEGMNKIWELYLQHHFFILPTRFDCTPIVFCEASAFGLPILSADTGGVAGHIFEGQNGFLIPFADKGEAYATKIIEIIANESAYESLCQSTRACFDSQLNWEAWGSRFKKCVDDI